MRLRDIVVAQIEHRETGTVPYTLPMEEAVGDQLDSYYGNTNWRNGIKQCIQRTDVVHTHNKTPTEKEGYEIDLYGTVWRTDRRPFHLESPGLREPDFTGYRWPAPEEFFADQTAIDNAVAFCGEAKDEYFVVGGLGWGLFETSWNLRGFENILMDYASNEDFCAELLDKITEQFLAYVEFTCSTLPDIDAIMFGDDWGDQRGVIIGPERWRKLFKPRYAKIYEAAHRHGKKTISHCCGSIADIMPDVIEIGLDVLESVQPEARDMNPYELKRRWGDRIAFWGCLGSQSTIQFGTPDDIHREVGRLKTEMSKGGGYILAPAKGLQPGTPIENAVAVVEAFV